MSAPALAAAAAVATRLLRLVKVAVDECIRRAVAYEVRAIAGSIVTRMNCISLCAGARIFYDDECGEGHDCG